MPDRRSWDPPPAPRPLAELPLETTLADAQGLARAWVLALIRSRPLEELGQLPLEELARSGPQLCGQILAAVRSDAELERLRAGTGSAGEPSPGAAARVGELTGARDAAELVEAVELLRVILCGTLSGQLEQPTARRSADLYERIAHVCTAVLTTALGRAPATSPSSGNGSSGPRGPQAAAAEEEVSWSPAAGARIVDELETVTPPPIEIRDERAEHGAAGWIDAIARQLERHQADGLPFTVLLVEVRELERLRLEMSPAELASLGAALEQALGAFLQAGGAVARRGFERGAAPWTGSVTPQCPGRCWVLAPETDRVAAHALADRVARSVASRVIHRGRALEVLVGVGVCPRDGRQAAALAAHADVDLHAARAARRSG
ncbi:MAG TPA: hypothetical protein VMB91_03025 [Solirubrobacteraceae bacterium]|nr:hypothetical protein [Solirubrobacteraceae bacterium]